MRGSLLLFYDEGNITAFGSNAGAYGATPAPVPIQRGIVFATTETDARYPAANYPKKDEAFSIVIAHEVTHLLIPDGTGGAFNGNEHIVAPNADATELMYEPRSRANRELATVKVFHVVQTVLKTKTSEGLDQ